MNYSGIYSKLINRALMRQYTEHLDGYYEQHHILPKALGGTDDLGNLVWLTVKEHYIAHLCLAMQDGLEDQWFAVENFLQDSMNPRKVNRFGKVRYKRWIRKRIAFHRALTMRNAAKLRLMQQYTKALEKVDEQYVDTFLTIAGIL